MSKKETETKTVKSQRSTSSRVSPVRIILVILLLLAGLGILLYPTISNLWNEHLHYKLIGNYEAEVAELPDERKEQLMADAASNYSKLIELGKEKEEIDQEIERKFERFMELQELVDKIG